MPRGVRGLRATASDACAGNVAVTTNNTVNPNLPGTYTIKYVATDPSRLLHQHIMIV